VLSAVALTRTLFHLVWLAGVVLLFAATRPGRRRTLACAAGPVLLVVLWYARTWAMFGSFAPSTWLGMNFAEITLEQGPLVERMRLVRDGKLSRYAVIAPFQPMVVYRQLREAGETTGVKALDEETKSTGERNFNHRDYVAISRIYLCDALQVVRERPAWYLRGVRTAVATFFRSPSSDPFLAANRSRIAGYDRVWTAAALGGVVAPAAFLVALAWAALRTARARRARTRSAAEVTVLYLAGTLFWVLLAGTLLDVGENNRFRFEAASHVVLLATAAVTGAIRRR
jgi:hypothetical protein